MDKEGIYTVEEMYNEMKTLKEKGLGDRVIVIPTDDEGNDYRPLIYQDILIEQEDIEEYLGEYYEDEEKYDSGCTCRYSPKDIVIL